MKLIEDIVEELRFTRGALVPAAHNPKGAPSPVITIEGESSIAIDLPQSWTYPSDGNSDRWPALDLAVESDLGLDALAWYVSFHHSLDEPLTRQKWGIFIPESSLVYCESRIFASLPGTREQKCQLAYEALLHHEQMHFAIDYACAQWEIMLDAPCWAAFRHRLRREGMSYFALEEQLANGFMLARAKAWPNRTARKALHTFVTKQPSGYRDGIFATDQRTLMHLFSEVLKSYVSAHAMERQVNTTASALDLATHMLPRHHMKRCPIHIIRDHSSIGLSNPLIHFISRLPCIVESPSFISQFRQLDNSIQARWAGKDNEKGMKQKLVKGIPPSADFKKINGAFSARLNDNYRVHLRPLNGYATWEAFSIGTHKEMRHG